MPLDHYVSQVHLKKFYSPALGDRMYAMRKSDNHAFICKSEDVCRTKDGSTNNYLNEPRLIEEFLLTVEPRYSVALDELRAGKPTSETVYVIAGFIAYIATCSPSAMRQCAQPLRAAVEITANSLDRTGAFGPTPPDVFGGKSLSELLADGTLFIDVDNKYPQAIGITSVIDLMSSFGNFRWEVLRNSELDSPFFTSDFPIAIEQSTDPRIMNRVIPLAPDLAVRIYPENRQERVTDLKFPEFRYTVRTAKASEVRAINRLIVQCAETLIFYRDDNPWVRPFVAKHSAFRIEPISDKIPTENGTFILNSIRVRR